MNSRQPEFPESGAHRLIGYEIDLTPSDGTARVILVIGPTHLNRNDSLHGGIVAMLLDSAAGFAASMHFGGDDVLQSVVTVSLTTSFIAAAREGRVVASGSVTGGGRKIVYAAAELRQENGTLIATASGVFKRIG